MVRKRYPLIAVLLALAVALTGAQMAYARGQPQPDIQRGDDPGKDFGRVEGRHQDGDGWLLGGKLRCPARRLAGADQAFVIGRHPGDGGGVLRPQHLPDHGETSN